MFLFRGKLLQLRTDCEEFVAKTSGLRTLIYIMEKEAAAFFIIQPPNQGSETLEIRKRSWLQKGNNTVYLTQKKVFGAILQQLKDATVWSCKKKQKRKK